VLGIIGGIGMMLSGNPAGFFIAASGAMSFGKGRGWQIGSQFMGLAGSAILMAQSFNSPALADGETDGTPDSLGRHKDPHRPGFNPADYNPGDVPLAEQWPAGSGDIASGYTSRHPALDISCQAWGCPVHATGEGVVFATRDSGTFRGLDNYVQVRIPGGYHELYSHVLPAEGLGPGTRVIAGQLLGSVDMSGTTAGPHVHYELRGRGGFGNLNPCLRLGCP
jgi:murein DD-endopeptidase MepM/ murein hydrolase activator NlpD